MNAPMISILVPVYQTEAYLADCLDSILMQTFADWELILVDDGSTDGCGAIIDSYAKKDRRIRAFHQPRAGQAAARNTGLSRARGKYITMVDSDDILLTPDYLKLLFEGAENHGADICLAGEIVFAGPVPEARGDGAAVFIGSGREFCYRRREFRAFDFGNIAARLIRRELFDGITYPAGHLAEDNAVAHRLIYPCKRLVFLRRQIYGYRRHKKSTLFLAPRPKLMQDTLLAFRDRMDYFIAAGEPELAKRAGEELLRILDKLKSP